jgi:hypothetical protein
MHTKRDASFHPTRACYTKSQLTNASTSRVRPSLQGMPNSFAKQNGGTFFAGAKGWGYGCMLDDGGCIVCGGLTAKQKSTCERTRVTPMIGPH